MGLGLFPDNTIARHGDGKLDKCPLIWFIFLIPRKKP